VEFLIFTTFIALQATAKNLPLVSKRIAAFAIVQRLSNNHWLVWFFHPVVLKGAHDYVVHFVIYSGYIIGH